MKSFLWPFKALRRYIYVVETRKLGLFSYGCVDYPILYFFHFDGHQRFYSLIHLFWGDYVVMHWSLSSFCLYTLVGQVLQILRTLLMHLLRRIITVNVAANKRVVQIFLVSTYEKCYHCPSDILGVWDKIYKNLHFSMG